MHRFLKYFPSKKRLKLFNEIIRGNDSRRQFFDKIINVVTLLGGDVSDAL